MGNNRDFDIDSIIENCTNISLVQTFSNETMDPPKFSNRLHTKTTLYLDGACPIPHYSVNPIHLSNVVLKWQRSDRGIDRDFVGAEVQQ
jgi:hypothetical protein